MSELNSLAAICIGCLDVADGGAQTPLSLARGTLHRSMLKSLAEISGAVKLRSTQDTSSALMTASRRMLELGMLAAQGQVDPIRLVATYLGSLADFEMGGRNNSSFNWQKDVFPEFSAKNGHWAQATLKGGPVRGILDGHLAVYLFKYAHQKVLDAAVQHSSKAVDMVLPEWVLNLQRFDDGEHVLNDLRKKAGDTYSALSKAVHFEFLGPLTADLDSQEAMSLVLKALEVSATVGLYAGASDISCSALNFEDVVRKFFEIATYAESELCGQIL